MRRLLVTGGAGFIGANFVHHWLREHRLERIVVLDALTYAGIWRISRKCSVAVSCDSCMETFAIPV